jgi:PEP-CTERM motif
MVRDATLYNGLFPGTEPVPPPLGSIVRVPEPSTLAALAVGIALTALRRFN